LIDFNENENFEIALSLIVCDNMLKYNSPNKNFGESEYIEVEKDPMQADRGI
jgi:hypothetical protein